MIIGVMVLPIIDNETAFKVFATSGLRNCRNHRERNATVNGNGIYKDWD